MCSGETKLIINPINTMLNPERGRSKKLFKKKGADENPLLNFSLIKDFSIAFARYVSLIMLLRD